MKNITFLYKSVLLVIALISCQGFSQNLLNNGDFETGGIVGFNINGAGYTNNDLYKKVIFFILK